MNRGVSAGGHETPVRGATNEWYTPQYILDAIGPFDDDPAKPGRTDGLHRSWKGFVFLNPPYGPECGTWLDRLVEHGNGIALVFARVETKWFRRAIWNKATALLFLYGRISFLRNGRKVAGNSGAPSVLIAYGPHGNKQLRECGLPGVLIERWRP